MIGSYSSYLDLMSLFADSTSCLLGLNIAPNFGSTLDITTPKNFSTLELWKFVFGCQMMIFNNF